MLPVASRTYRKLRDPLKSRIDAAINSLGAAPRPPGAVKLAGRDDYRVRVGDHRIVYAIDEDDGVVIIARIAHRREAYRR